MKQQEIRAVSYVHVGEKLVRFDDLTPEQKAGAATELKKGYLNALFRGRATFDVDHKNRT